MNHEDFKTTNSDLRSLKLKQCDLQEEAEQITTGALRDADREIAEWDAAQIAVIGDTLTDDNKNWFANAEARAAELAIRQSACPDRVDLDRDRDGFTKQLAAIRFQQARNAVEIGFLSNDLQYDLHHAPDEINLAIAGLVERVEKASGTAALRAVALVMANLANNAIDRLQTEPPTDEAKEQASGAH